MHELSVKCYVVCLWRVLNPCLWALLVLCRLGLLSPAVMWAVTKRLTAALTFLRVEGRPWWEWRSLAGA